MTKFVVTLPESAPEARTEKIRQQLAAELGVDPDCVIVLKANSFGVVEAQSEE